MPILKCKMCAGELSIENGTSIATCEYCGTKQTVPTADNEKKMALFGRANRLRFSCEFDKAAGVYESIVAEFPTESEAYWGLVLCKYGIEYVDDPATGKKIPTCHRSSFESVMDDENFEQAQENADALARSVYREEAKQIEELRKGIIEISGKEAPYDIFICYKEKAEDGGRTLDSVLAQDVYNALTEKGYRVFFSRISLEDKLGQEYEPYIFAALNSAKVMLAFGTSYENYNAVWVKNEWSRFLQLIAKGEKKVLIPCYKDIDAYDMPKEFTKLQGQDMGKIGAVQDLIRGVEKLLPKNVTKEEPAASRPIAPQSATIDSLLQRVTMYLEDGEWDNARDYCNRVLDIDPKNAIAYVGLLMVDLKVRQTEELGNGIADYSENNNYKKAIRFASPEYKKTLEELLEAVHRNIREKKRIEEEQRKELIKEISNKQKKAAQIRNLIACDFLSTVGLKTNGTLIAVGNNDQGQCNVSDWRGVTAIACGHNCTFGLKADGTVVAVGSNAFEKIDVSDWRNVVAIAGGFNHTIGLKTDGSVVAVGSNACEKINVSDWRNVVAVACGFNHTIGLKADGTVVATGDNNHGQCNVSNWSDIVGIDCGKYNTIGLKADGTVVAVGGNDHGQCDVNGWHDIIAIACGFSHTVGLKKDGTIVAVGLSFKESRSVSRWRDIVAIACGCNHTVGLKADGTVVAVGNNEFGQCNVSGWKLFDNTETIDEEIQAAKEKAINDAYLQAEAAKVEAAKAEAAKAEAIRAAQELKFKRRAQGVCQYCGGTFKGVFGKKCSNCGRPKDY